MGTMERLIFNDNQVRKSFKSKLCKEFILPSGKPSGFYKFPITSEEINEIMKEYADVEKPKKFFTWSEWALFVALRRKYGFNYLKPKEQKFLPHIDTLYEEPKNDESLEDKLLFYCDSKLDEIVEIFCKAEPPRDTENEKPPFRNQCIMCCLRSRRLSVLCTLDSQ